MRKYLLLLVFATLLGCTKDRQGAGELTDFIPASSGIILKLQDPDLFFSNLQNNEFLKKNKNFPLYHQIVEETQILDLIQHKDPAYLSFSFSGRDSLHFSFITRQSQLSSIDSTGSTEKYRQITELEFNGRQAYLVVKDSVLILSSSRNLLKESLRNETPLADLPDFEKALKASSSKKPSIFIHHKKAKPLIQKWFPNSSFSQLPSFSNWTVLDSDFTQNEIKLHGISTAGDTVPRLINVFKNVNPAENLLGSISPLNSTGFYSVTFKDFKQLSENLQTFNGKAGPEASKELDLLQNSVEVGMIYTSEATVLAVRIPGNEFASSFSSDLNLAENFRETTLFEYPKPKVFAELLKPLLKPKNLKYFAVLDQFAIFSESAAALKEVISSFQNEQVLNTSKAYSSAFESLSSEASILLVSNNKNFKNELTDSSSDALKEEIEKLDFDGFPLSALQFVYQSDFAHVHAIISKNEDMPATTGTSQLSSVKLAAALATQPVFFRNHRTNGMDVAVQDIENTLYLIAPTGKIYWKKKLDSRILGEIVSVDLFRNGRYQLAFATQNKLHVIDRDGNRVKPFPLEFRDEITQPLAVFDYENNRDYRFVIVQNKEVFMYDKKGRQVKGFEFRKASDRILHPPKHIRIGRKDYIVIAEEGGKIDILSRTGKTRVAVKEEVAFSDNEWYEYNGNFVSTNAKGQLVSISENGKIKREDRGLSDTHKITATEKTFVSLSDNILQIKNNTATLDFGLYTAPRIFYLNNKIYVSVTDLQTHKVYLFDSNAELINGFPVYGSSAIDLANAEGDSAPEIVLKGEEDSVLVYKVN